MSVFWFIESLLLKTYWWGGWHWPAARKLRISGIQKVETPIFGIWDPNWSILNKIGRNPSFTRPGGWSIASSRSGTYFSSCLASSIYFSIRKSVFFLGTTSFCVCAHNVQTHFWTLQYRNNVSLRMANRYTRIFDAGWSGSPSPNCSFVLPSPQASHASNQVEFNLQGPESPLFSDLV